MSIKHTDFIIQRMVRDTSEHDFVPKLHKYQGKSVASDSMINKENLKLTIRI